MRNTVEDHILSIENDEIRLKAYSNALHANRYNTCNLDIYAGNIVDAINFGFNWSGTPEGHTFWSTISRKIQEGSI